MKKATTKRIFWSYWIGAAVSFGLYSTAHELTSVASEPARTLLENFSSTVAPWLQAMLTLSIPASLPLVMSFLLHKFGTEFELKGVGRSALRPLLWDELWAPPN